MITHGSAFRGPAQENRLTVSLALNVRLQACMLR